MNNKTMMDRSNRIPPRVIGGINRRSSLTGGSVIVKIASRMTTTNPVGRQSRAKVRTNSTIIRAMSNRPKDKQYEVDHREHGHTFTLPDKHPADKTSRAARALRRRGRRRFARSDPDDRSLGFWL